MNLRLPPLSSITNLDEQYMFQALKEAWKAFDEDEVPVGAVVTFQNKIVARAHNQVEQLQDATAHAEMLAIGSAASFLGNWRLEECTLYTTLEPCIMCAGAMILSRLGRVVWGTKDLRHGASIAHIFEIEHPIHHVETVPFVLQDWCTLPLKSFFQKRREEQEG